MILVIIVKIVIYFDWLYWFLSDDLIHNCKDSYFDWLCWLISWSDPPSCINTSCNHQYVGWKFQVVLWISRTFIKATWVVAWNPTEKQYFPILVFDSPPVYWWDSLYSLMSDSSFLAFDIERVEDIPIDPFEFVITQGS